MKPSHRSIDNFQSYISNSRSNIEGATNFQSNNKNLQLTVQRPRVLETFNESLSENKDSTREINNFKNATRGNSRQIFPKCDVITNNGTQCLNSGNLSVNKFKNSEDELTPFGVFKNESETRGKRDSGNSCNNYCMNHSDAWINSMTTNPYIVSDTSGNIVNSDLVYDISVKTVGKSINQYLPSVTDINGKYKIDFKINGHLNLPMETTDNKTNELVEEFLQNESDTRKKPRGFFKNASESFVENKISSQTKNNNQEVPEYYKTTPEYLEALKRIDYSIKNKFPMVRLNNLNLQYCPDIPTSITEIILDDNKLKLLPKLHNNIKYISCTNNLIEYLPENLPTNLAELYCSKNKIKLLPKNLPKKLESIEFDSDISLLRSQMRFITDGRNFKIYYKNINKYFNYFQPEEYKEVSEDEYNNLLIESTDEKLVDEYATEVPEYYKSTPEYLEALKRIDYSIKNKFPMVRLNNLNLQYCPDIPTSITEIILDDNKLKLLPKLHNNIKYISCTNNLIEYLPENLPTNLAELYCSKNKIKLLPKNLPKKLESIEFDSDISLLRSQMRFITDGRNFKIYYKNINKYFNYFQPEEYKEVSEDEYNNLLIESKKISNKLVGQFVENKNINDIKTNNWVDEFDKSETKQSVGNKWADEFLNKALPSEFTSITLTDLTTNKSINITANDLEYLDYKEFLKWCLNPRNAQLQSISKHLTNYNTKLNVKNKINNKDVSTEWQVVKGKKIIFSNTPQIKSRM